MDNSDNLLHRFIARVKAKKQVAPKRMASFTRGTFETKLQNIKSINKDNILRKRVQLVSEEVDSKMAQFYIVDTFLTMQKIPRLQKITLQDIIDRWNKEMDKIDKLTSLRRKTYSNRLDRAVYFATHCLHHLLGDEASLSERPCPLSSNAWNFISTLMLNDECLCLCYASYIRAAAEEFGYDNFIYMCNGTNTSSIVVVDMSNKSEEIVSKEDIRNFYVVGVPKYLQEKNTLRIGDIFTVPDIITHIGINYDEQFTVDIETKDSSFKKKFLFDVPSLHKHVTNVRRFTSVCNKALSWYDISILMTRIVAKKNTEYMFAELLCLGHVYNVSPVIDAIITLFLIYSQRELENKNLAWKEFVLAKEELENIAIAYLDFIYTYLDNMRATPFVIQNVLVIPDLLLAKHKTSRRDTVV